VKISPAGAEFFHEGGQTERQTDRQLDGHDEALSRFSQFYESA